MYIYIIFLRRVTIYLNKHWYVIYMKVVFLLEKRKIKRYRKKDMKQGHLGEKKDGDKCSKR